VIFFVYSDFGRAATMCTRQIRSLFLTIVQVTVYMCFLQSAVISFVDTSDTEVEGVDLHKWAEEGMHDEYRWEMFSTSLQRVRTLLGMTDRG
jgi:hypothetical protein